MMGKAGMGIVPCAAWAGPVPAAGRECCAANNPAAARHLLCHTLHFTFWSYLSGVRSALGIAPWLLVAEGRPTELSQDPEVHGVCVWGGGMHLIHRSPPSPERCSFQSHWSEHAHTQEHCVPPHNLHTHSCTHIFMHTHKHTCLHVPTHACACGHVHAHTCAHACMHAHTLLMHAHMCVHKDARTHACSCACMHVCTHTCACTYLCVHAPTRTHMVAPHAHLHHVHPPACPAHHPHPCTRRGPVCKHPPPLLCTRLLLPITCTRTDTCVQAAACCAHTSAHTPTPAHTHTHV